VLAKHHAPAIGFVNEIKLNTPDARDAYAAMLQQWLDAGDELGCHGYSHLALSDVTLEAYEADFYRGTVITSLMMHQAGKRERYYRYPFNDTGDTAAKHNGFSAFLTAQHYDPAPMTLENDDYLYSALYDDALKRNDAATAARVKQAYLDENAKKTAFIEATSMDEFGRLIPQIADLHVNPLNADALDDLLTQFEQHGYKFISLDAALADPAYKTPDNYIGRGGISWLERWSVALGKPMHFPNDPDPPKWALDAAKALHAAN
jgi:peptidoglycan-N-acetylglucosamine deacetylase